MKKIILISLVALLAFCNCAPVKAGVEKKLNNVIKEQNIAVSNNTIENLDTLENLVNQTRTDSVTVNDLTHMQPGEGWLKNNWSWLLTTLIFLLEIFLRVAPTGKDWSIINKILSILIWIWRIIPNNAKVRDSVIKRGYDLRVKKTIEAYKNKQ